RHTSSKRDWSSDVCSSDLTLKDLDGLAADGVTRVVLRVQTPESGRAIFSIYDENDASAGVGTLMRVGFPDEQLSVETHSVINKRSEERRVGKERRRGCMML